MRYWLAFFMVLFTVTAGTDTTITRKYYLNNDNWILAPGLGDPVNYGQADTLLVGEQTISEGIALMSPDITDLDNLNDSLDNLDITEVVCCTLYILGANAYNFDGDEDLYLYPLLIPFDEDESDWDSAESGVAWNTAGCKGSGTDYDNTYEVTVSIGDSIGTGTYKFVITSYMSAVAAQTVGRWEGYRLSTDLSKTERIVYSSSEQAGTIFDPYVEIKYTYTLPEAGWSIDWHSPPDWNDANIDWNSGP